MDQGELPPFEAREGLALAISYIDDPSAVPCPRCGPGTMEIVAYLDPISLATDVARLSEPTGEYAVLLYCHDCRRAAALHFSPRLRGNSSQREHPDAA